MLSKTFDFMQNYSFMSRTSKIKQNLYVIRIQEYFPKNQKI